MPRRSARRGPPYDLFGEIPVTWDEVWEWVENNVGLQRTSWRAAYYIRWWNVADKIRQEKLRHRRRQRTELHPVVLHHLYSSDTWSSYAAMERNKRCGQLQHYIDTGAMPR